MRFSADFNRLSRMSISRWRASSLLATRLQAFQDRALRGRDLRLGFLRLTAAPSDLVSGAAGFGASFGAPWVEPVMSGSSRLAGKFRFSCAQDFLVVVRLVVEDIAAIDHKARDLQRGEASDGDQHDRNDADVAKRLHTLTLCGKTVGSSAFGEGFGRSRHRLRRRGAWPRARRPFPGSVTGRAAIAILDRRRTTLSASPSCL